MAHPKTENKTKQGYKTSITAYIQTCWHMTWILSSDIARNELYNVPDMQTSGMSPYVPVVAVVKPGGQSRHNSSTPVK